MIEDNVKIVEKFTAVKLDFKNIDFEYICNLSFGAVSGPYYNETRPRLEFDTRIEAIEYAYEQDMHSNWAIIPIVSFKHKINK